MQSLPLPFIATDHLGTSAWLLRLRWFAVFGQLATVSVAGAFGSDLPWAPLLGLIALTAVSNAAYALWLQRANRGRQKPTDAAGDRVARADKIATSLMMMDLVTLTAMLYFSGGIDNPFSLFYFVNLAVGGVILRPRWAWALTAMAILGCGLLIYASLPIAGLIEPQRQGEHSLHTLGLFIAYATCGSVVTHFVTRTAAELTRSERLLSETQAEHQRVMRLEGLTTLAAGAAHELATPLSTIDVIARELGRHLQDCETPESVREDVRLIDQQLEICRQILRRMRVAVGDSMADWLAYGMARQTVKDSSDFGRGDIRGVIAPESANNAKEAGTLVPTLLFGIPGSPTAAILLGGLLLLGLQAGPSMVDRNLDVTLSIIWTLALANVIAAAACFLLTNQISKISLIPAPKLVPFLLVIMVFASYQATRSWGDILAFLLLGLLSWVMKQLAWPRAPMIIGFVLASATERYLYLSMGRYGLDWISRPGVLILGALIVGIIAFGAVRSSKKAITADTESRIPTDATE
jgi:signal transduction histidine kinase